MNFFEADHRSALQSKQHAQWIAFAPSVFQATRSLRESGALSAIESAGAAGLTFDEVAAAVELPRYGLRVLLEAGLGIGLLVRCEDRFRITKTAWFVLHDRLTRANMDFTHDVNYRGLFALDESIRTGRAEGLKTFGRWDTIYEALGDLPPATREAWLRFVHYYSDDTFSAVLPHVFANHPRRLLDVGGNTGRWALRCVGHDPAVEVTIADLPGALQLAGGSLAGIPEADRIRLHAVDVLDARQPLPPGFDVVWMSQFLDCFSEAEIVRILEKCAAALAPGGRVCILEPFWDRQRFETSAFCLQQVSLYFAAIANGRSQMYESTLFVKLVAEAGFEVERQIDHLGVSHSLLVCRPTGSAA
ncbi:MAG TPA: methyltransferase [Nevskiaceae bacterium]|nr:methyltransferase [Nevskiaceae bacterium]